MRAEGEPIEQTPGGRLAPAAMSDSLNALSASDFARLQLAAKGFSNRCGIPWEDLLQEAYMRALSGTRTCRNGVETVAFMCGVMKSLASQANEARKTSISELSVTFRGEDAVLNVPAVTPNPEQIAISTFDLRNVLASIEAATVGDEEVQLLIEGICDQMRGEQLQELLGVDAKGLATIRKRLRRIILDLPQGGS